MLFTVWGRGNELVGDWEEVEREFAELLVCSLGVTGCLEASDSEPLGRDDIAFVLLLEDECEPEGDVLLLSREERPIRPSNKFYLANPFQRTYHHGLVLTQEFNMLYSNTIHYFFNVSLLFALNTQCGT